jgi:alpha/beta superfamily hydrolase
VTDRRRLPGPRDARASLDARDADRVVVACPPHPQRGGTRHDPRLRAVSDALDADCLRVGYGPWDKGRGERTDARAALRWATDRYDAVSLFGYSFGGGVALAVAGDDPRIDAVAALAPAARLPDGTDAADAITRIEVPLWVGYGTDDDAVDTERTAAAARDAGATVESFDADHGFGGATDGVAEGVAAFLAP